ncbi:MAG: elongation factor G [Chitinispirillaceae bacterium]|nr:elongation factor G [Chitinispirillaceae bacterium]
MSFSISKMRNIGISAHIDSGKTTLTERFLYYCKKIHAIHEVKGKDGVGATMDSMDLERERGITIQSAATNVVWLDHSITIIDTPGHVDFTIEVERALRVLDGAILVLCSVGGVQSQSITVDQQLKRYNVPRIAFINKSDRSGANPYRVTEELCEKLGHHAVLMQIPIGVAESFAGVIDLVTMKALYFDGNNGEIIREEAIPADLAGEAQTYREKMLDSLTLFSDELAESCLKGTETCAQIRAAARKGTVALQITPVFIGSAYKNKGVQPLLDGVVHYLASPEELAHVALDLDNNEAPVALSADAKAPAIALAFKLEDGQYGQLTFIRMYQGTIRKGSELYNTRSKKWIKVGRLVRTHADSLEDIGEAGSGDIVALFGIDCASGDTFTENRLNYAMSSMFVPEPVISLAVKPTDRKSADNLGKALNRFIKEDPTFRSFVDPESGETIIKGMGELHLDVYLERMRREYDISLQTGMPQVAYRETLTSAVRFDYTHKKQTGGAGQYARVAGIIEPHPEKEYEFINAVKGGAIPSEYVPSCDKGFRSCLAKGTVIGFPIVGVKCTIDDGNWHPVDSSEIAFQTASIQAFWQAYGKARIEIIEPIMKVSVEGPTEFQGNILATINQRRGMVISSTEENRFCRIDAEVPLSEMFGYSTVLRSNTQGKAEFTMEFIKYGTVPLALAEKLKKEFHEKKKAR